MSGSKSLCSPPGASGLWPEQEHRLRAALSRTADRKCTLSCALFFITIISEIDTCTPLLISTYSSAYAGASLGRAVKISGVWKILKSCSCPRDVVVTAPVVQQQEERKFHGSEQRMGCSLFSLWCPVGVWCAVQLYRDGYMCYQNKVTQMQNGVFVTPLPSSLLSSQQLSG